MINYISAPFKWFFKLEAAGGLVLLIGAAIALFLSNSSLSKYYFDLLNTNILIGQFQLGKSHNDAIIGKEIIRGKIGGSCIAIRSEIAREIKWPLRGGGDFFFITRVINKYDPKYPEDLNSL